MSEAVTGVVTVRNPRGTGVQIDGSPQWYNASPGMLETAVPGAKVKLTVNRKGTSAFVNGVEVLEAAKEEPTNNSAPVNNYEKQQADRQSAIVYQSARNAAIELTGIALQAEAIPLPTKKADKWDALKAFVDELTVDFVEAVNNNSKG